MSLHDRAAPAAGQGGSGSAPCPPAALGGQEEGVAAKSRSRAGAQLDDTHTLVKIRLVWMLLFSEVEAPQERCLPNGTSTSEAHLRYSKSVTLENYKWCSKSRVVLCQKWGLTRRT